MSWPGWPLSRATKPTPQASCSNRGSYSPPARGRSEEYVSATCHPGKSKSTKKTGVPVLDTSATRSRAAGIAVRGLGVGAAGVSHEEASLVLASVTFYGGSRVMSRLNVGNDRATGLFLVELSSASRVSALTFWCMCQGVTRGAEPNAPGGARPCRRRDDHYGWHPGALQRRGRAHRRRHLHPRRPGLAARAEPVWPGWWHHRRP